jgi:hypothetical protein
MERRRAEVWVPERLSVKVGVDVDETRRHDPPVGVDGPPGRFIARPDRHDAPVAYPDVGAAPGSAGAIDDVAFADQQVQHGSSSCQASPG